MLSDKDGLLWLSNKLKSMNESGFRQSELYKLLKDELTKRDHWKAKRRGKPQTANILR